MGQADQALAESGGSGISNAWESLSSLADLDNPWPSHADSAGLFELSTLRVVGLEGKFPKKPISPISLDFLPANKAGVPT